MAQVNGGAGLHRAGGGEGGETWVETKPGMGSVIGITYSSGTVVSEGGILNSRVNLGLRIKI